MLFIDRRIEQLAQIDRLGLAVRQFDADHAAPRHDRDAHRDGAHRAGDVVGEPDDARGLDAGRRLQLVEGHDRTGADLHDLAAHAVILEHGFEHAGVFFERLLVDRGGLGGRRPLQQIERAAAPALRRARGRAGAGAPPRRAVPGAAGRVVRRDKANEAAALAFLPRRLRRRPARSRRGSRRSGSGVTTPRRLRFGRAAAAASAGRTAPATSAAAACRQPAAASIVPRPDKTATRPAPRPAPPPSSRQSRQDSPRISSSSKPSPAAAIIDTGSASGAEPGQRQQPLHLPAERRRHSRPRRESRHGRAPTTPAPPATSAAGNRPSLSHSDCSGRSSSSRNDQPTSTSGITKAAKPRLWRNRSASIAPSWPRKLCGPASIAVSSDGSRGS